MDTGDSGQAGGNSPSQEDHKPIFLMSQPKTGTMLLRNIVVRLFEHGHAYNPLVFTHEEAVAAVESGQKLAYGHLPYSPESSTLLADWNKVLLLRSPADTVVALARACLDERSERADHRFLRKVGATVEQIVPLIVFGYELEGVRQGPFWDSYQAFVGGWLGDSDQIVRFGDLVKMVGEVAKGGGEEESKHFFTQLGVPRMADWRDRVLAGAEPTISETAIAPLAAEAKIRCREFAQRFLDGSLKANTDTFLGDKLLVDVNLLHVQELREALTYDPELFKAKLLEMDFGSRAKLMAHLSASLESVQPTLEAAQGALPADGQIAYLLAFSQHCLRHDLPKALELYGVALDSGYDEFWVRFQRARVEIMVKRLDEARIDLRRCVELVPNHGEAKRLLEETETHFKMIGRPLHQRAISKASRILRGGSSR